MFERSALETGCRATLRAYGVGVCDLYLLAMFDNAQVKYKGRFEVFIGSKGAREITPFAQLWIALAGPCDRGTYISTI